MAKALAKPKSRVEKRIPKGCHFPKIMAAREMNPIPADMPRTNWLRKPMAR